MANLAQVATSLLPTPVPEQRHAARKRADRCGWQPTMLPNDNLPRGTGNQPLSANASIDG